MAAVVKIYAKWFSVEGINGRLKIGRVGVCFACVVEGSMHPEMLLECMVAGSAVIRRILLIPSRRT